MDRNCSIKRHLATRGLLGAVVATLFGIATIPTSASAQTRAGWGELRLDVIDRETKAALPCRIHLKNDKGVAMKATGLPFWHDHVVCDGSANFELRRGNYTFVVECGPEYVQRTGYFRIEDFAKDQKTVDLQRAIDMASANWWSGDLGVHRPLDQIELLMRADDLHVAPVITWTGEKSQWAKTAPPARSVVRFDTTRFIDQLGGEVARPGGTLRFFRLRQPLDPASPTLVDEARAAGAWIDVPNPSAWNLPIWLAAGAVDSIGLAHDGLRREGGEAKSDGTRPRDKTRYGGARGVGLWTQDIYHHVLNAGLRIPPSAGSGTGEAPNPLGYNRMYAWVDRADLSYDGWWDAVRAGRVVVTNGPLIQPQANGRDPGHVFHPEIGGDLELDVAMNLTTRDKIRYVELLRNGTVVESLRIEDWAKMGGHFSPLVVQESGWVAVRVVTELENTYRFAASAPWYIEIGPPRISRRSVQFFLDWLDEGVAQGKLTGDIESARAFWQTRLESATAE